jgi:hypothetical protein
MPIETQDTLCYSFLAESTLAIKSIEDILVQQPARFSNQLSNMALATYEYLGLAISKQLKIVAPSVPV